MIEWEELWMTSHKGGTSIFGEEEIFLRSELTCPAYLRNSQEWEVQAKIRDKSRQDLKDILKKHLEPQIANLTLSQYHRKLGIYSLPNFNTEGGEAKQMRRRVRRILST